MPFLLTDPPLDLTVTLGNTPNTDILSSNLAGARFVHTKVKTFIPGRRTCSVGPEAERNFGNNFFWVLGGVRNRTQRDRSNII